VVSQLLSRAAPFVQPYCTTLVYTRRKRTPYNMAGKKVVYRDSKTGEFLTQRQAERKDPATWERQHVPVKAPKK
jgi:hypothetical protein